MIIGDGVIPEAACVYDVRDAIGRDDVVLLAHVAKKLGQTIPEGSTIYNFEPLYDGCRSLSLGYLDVLRAHKVWDYQAKNVEWLKRRGVDAMRVPYGYTPALERAPVKSKDIDVLFFGSMSPRRDAKLAEIREQCKVVTAHGVYGAELDSLIARARVVVNIHFTDHPHPLEVVRINYLMANGCAVVTEPGWDEQENAAYAPGVVFSDNLAFDCAKWVKADLSAISEAARRTIQSMPMKVPA
jgi:hypothetical protein